MIIQATPYGTKKEEPFALTYSGDFTDSRVDGIGDVTLNTSGTLVTTGQTVKVKVYILAGGGGAACNVSQYWSKDAAASGGGGGNQEVEVTLEPGTYEIVIGTGGTAANGTGSSELIGGTGGDTIAFGVTSTGGGGGKAKAGTSSSSTRATAGLAGSPNATAGTKKTGESASGVYNLAGGTPNGGQVTPNSSSSATGYPGGNGLVRITFS